ncbi:MAG TPA: GNAT family N-acetyltransferase [Gemmatimonadales bacterium]|nr:GNAT family N-acetyltransferase [Gemmatimonadales bacterium]
MTLANTLTIGRPHAQHRSLVALIEERLIIPSYASDWAAASIGLHRLLSLPLQVTGEVRRRSVHVADETIDILGVGRDKLIGSFYSGLLGTLPSATYEGRRLTVRPKILTTLPADLIAVEVNRLIASKFRDEGWLIVPRTVRWHGELATVPPPVPSKSLASNLAKLRRQDFQLVQSTSLQDWDEFYRTMVAPQAHARHGSEAWIPSQSFLRQLSEIATLHFVVENGIRVAGVCAVPHGDTVWFPLMGVCGGDPGLLQRGAGVATLALPLEWARQKNYRRIDLGRTGPFVNDGLQRYKRKWGFVPVPDPLSLVVAVWTGSAKVRRAFSREPVLIETQRGLETYAGEVT